MKYRDYITPFIFGFIGIFSFAPFSIKPLIFFSYAYLISQLIYKNKNRFYKLFFWSLAHWGFGMSWLIVSVYYYGETSLVITFIIFILLLLLLMVAFSAPLFFISRALISLLSPNNIINILLISSVLIINEWTMNFLLYGIPWLISGSILLDTFSQNIYPFLGISGGSLLIFIISGLLASAWDHKKRLFYVLATIPFLLSIPYEHKTSNDKDYDLNFSIIQPSTDPFLKYKNGYASKIEDNIYKLLPGASANSKLVILPEAELPYPAQDNRFNNFKMNMPENVIMGVWSYRNENLYNSIINTSNNNTYDKVHLVPFGEFIPFSKQLRGLISFFDMPMSYVQRGKDQYQSFYLSSERNINISTLICFDIAFSETVRKSNISSKFIVNVSNDTWFGNSIGPYHHLDISRVRAIENNRWLIRAANDGFSAIIDNNGTIVDKLNKGEKGVLNGSLKYISERTFYSKHGHSIVILFSFLMLFCSSIINICRKISV